MKWKLLLGVLFISLSLHAQNWEEWTRQKRTQLKYLRQQIVATQVYIGYVKKGYAIARDGLTFIGDVKDGEFSLHRNYFSSLSAINPAISKSVIVDDMVITLRQVREQASRHLLQLRESGQFADDEVKVVRLQLNNRVRVAEVYLEQLIELVSPGTYVMRDAERIERIEVLQQSFAECVQQFRSYLQSNLVLAVQRLQSSHAIDKFRKLYNLK